MGMSPLIFVKFRGKFLCIYNGQGGLITKQLR
nr:MAG TPA: hypothetical protein [Bacteriophage sp.]